MKTTFGRRVIITADDPSKVLREVKAKPEDWSYIFNLAFKYFKN